MIGIFDSGLGGLTVLKAIQKQLPQYDYIYLGDTARSPYGGHSPETITEYSKQAADWLFNQGCELVIFACHTASASALRTLQQTWLTQQPGNKRILGVTIPLAEAAVEVTKGRVGILATRATVDSKTFVKELKKLKPKLDIIQQAAPLLVPLIEEGWIKSTITRHILKTYLRPLKSTNVDTLILGCTHYPWLEPMIKEIMGKQTKIIEAGPIVAAKLKEYLNRHPEIETKLSKGKTLKMATTDDPLRFKKQAAPWWTGSIDIKQAILN